MPADCLALLTNGDIFTGIACPFTNIFPDGWFYAIMILILEISIFLKYDNMIAPSIFGVFIGSLMIPFMPPSVTIVPILIIVVNFAAVLYAVAFRGE